MSYSTTQEQLPNKEWIENLKICLCGHTLSGVESSSIHKGCIISGIGRNLFTDKNGWIEYCKENGQRIAVYYLKPRDISNM